MDSWGEFRSYYQSEVKVTKQDFDDEYHAKGWSQARIDQKWNAYKACRCIQREGRGASLALWIPQRREWIVDRSPVQTNTYSEEKESEKRFKAHDVFAIKDSCYDPSLDLGDSSFTEDAIKDETPLGPTLDAASFASLSGSPLSWCEGY